MNKRFLRLQSVTNNRMNNCLSISPVTLQLCVIKFRTQINQAYLCSLIKKSSFLTLESAVIHKHMKSEKCISPVAKTIPDLNSKARNIFRVLFYVVDTFQKKLAAVHNSTSFCFIRSCNAFKNIRVRNINIAATKFQNNTNKSSSISITNLIFNFRR